VLFGDYHKNQNRKFQENDSKKKGWHGGARGLLVIGIFIQKYGQVGTPTLTVTPVITGELKVQGPLGYINYVLEDGWDTGYDSFKKLMDRFDAIGQKQDAVNIAGWRGAGRHRARR
jgi:hypothetical protein